MILFKMHKTTSNYTIFLIVTVQDYQNYPLICLSVWCLHAHASLINVLHPQFLHLIVEMSKRISSTIQSNIFIKIEDSDFHA